ncbi:hypothetical protein PACTADRAFT_50315 [Pachysolen tannophilus NRRL Y-2460]|uniref:Uncharacterized protein n=1 Tax=Pachysolen tannophilus NRRL Y-2460 TaxID=669874 RepID=A0A1E4TV73_PACTA|nr:hypothetical protein PACTADRAFT_50315 [Pachysolen tannophilus NRRL Y-2460]
MVNQKRKNAEKNAEKSFQNTDKLSEYAQKYWLGKKNVKKIDNKLVGEIWSMICSSENQGEIIDCLNKLEYLPRFLWPLFHEDGTREHVNSVIFLFPYSLDLVVTDKVKFKQLYFRVLSMYANMERLNLKDKEHLLSFMNCLMLNFGNAIVKEVISPLVSISSWEFLTYKDNLLISTGLTKVYESELTIFKKLKGEEKGNAYLQKCWFYNLLIDHMKLLLQVKHTDEEDIVHYNKKIVQFLINVLSQLPTRKFINTLVKEISYLAALKKISPSPSVDYIALLEYFVFFPINDFESSMVNKSLDQLHSEKISKLQRVAFAEFNDSLSDLATTNFGNLEGNFKEFFNKIDDLKLEEFLRKINLQIDFPFKVDRNFMLKAIELKYKRPTTVYEISETIKTLPKESDLYKIEHDYPATAEGNFFLNIEEFLLRNLTTLQKDFFRKIAHDIQDTINNLKIKNDELNGFKITGSDRYTLGIDQHIIIHEIEPATIESKYPLKVNAEIIIDYFKVSHEFRKEWDNLSKGDIVFLLQIIRPDSISNSTNSKSKPSNALKLMRSAEVLEILDGNGKPLSSFSKNDNRRRRLYVNIDPKQFVKDSSKIYEGFSFIVRNRDNALKNRMDTIKEIIKYDKIELPEWFNDYFLGFENMNKCDYRNQENRPLFLKFNEIFNSVDNLKDVFKDYSLKFGLSEEEPTKKKRKVAIGNKKEEEEFFSKNNDIEFPVAIDFSLEANKELTVCPYIDISCESKQDLETKFSSKEIELLISGMSTGLTVIEEENISLLIKIINSIIYNFPEERIVIVCKDSKNLSEIRNLLNVNEYDIYFTTNKNQSSKNDGGKLTNLLKNVDTLAIFLQIDGAHGDSPETAIFFFKNKIQPLWSNFLKKLHEKGATNENLLQLYPFNTNSDTIIDLKTNFEKNLIQIINHYRNKVLSIFNNLNHYREQLVTHDAKILMKNSKIILMTPQEILQNYKHMGKTDSIILLHQLHQLHNHDLDLEMLLLSNQNLKRIIKTIRTV